jgi:hypothetical protein
MNDPFERNLFYVFPAFPFYALHSGHVFKKRLMIRVSNV